MTFQLKVDKSFLSNLGTSQPLASTNLWEEKLKRIHDVEVGLKYFGMGIIPNIWYDKQFIWESSLSTTLAIDSQTSPKLTHLSIVTHSYDSNLKLPDTYIQLHVPSY